MCAKVPMTNGSNDFAHLHNECKFVRICLTYVCECIQNLRKVTEDFSELLTGKTTVLTSFFYEKEQGSTTSEAEVLPVNGKCLTYGSVYGLA